MFPSKSTGLHAGKCSVLAAYRVSCIFSGFGVRKAAFSIETWKFFLLMWIAKRLTLRLFFFSLSNRMDFIGVVLGKNVYVTAGNLGCLTFPIARVTETVLTMLPASVTLSPWWQTCQPPQAHSSCLPWFCGNGISMQPSTSEYAPGCTGGVLSNFEKENLRDVDVLSFGLLLQKHRVYYSGSCWIVCCLEQGRFADAFEKYLVGVLNN